MKKRKLLIAFAIILFSYLVFSPTVQAASSTYNFSGSAGAFGGKYNKFVAEDSQTSRTIKYIKLNFRAYDGNKLKFSLLHTQNWLSTATEVASSGTLAAKNNKYIIYAIPVNMSCPSDANLCLTMPKKYSADGRGNDIGFDFMTGFRFKNESWFYGTLHISGSYTLYY